MTLPDQLLSRIEVSEFMVIQGALNLTASEAEETAQRRERSDKAAKTVAMLHVIKNSVLCETVGWDTETVVTRDDSSCRAQCQATAQPMEHMR